jgi:hypothetical protein
MKKIKLRLITGVIVYCAFSLSVMARNARLVRDTSLTVSSNFESGSARILSIDKDKQFVSITPAGNPKRGMPNWWYLRIDHIDTSKTLLVEVVASDAAVYVDGGGLGGKLPPGWTLPLRAACSTNGQTWAQTAEGSLSENKATYSIKTKSTTVWLAWGPPFTQKDAVEFVTRMERSNSCAKAFVLCTSKEGRSVPALQIMEENKSLKQRPVIWVDARQHAWEAGGSWVGVGFVEWLLSNDERAKWLRQNTEVVFVPIMDVDHVSSGDGGKHALPQDHNLDWTASAHWPEVAASQKRLLAIANEGRMNIFLDLHNPGSGNQLQTLYVIDTEYMKPEAEPRKKRFVELMIKEFGEIKQIAARPPVKHPELFHQVSVPWVLEHTNPQTIAFCVETPWNSPNGTTAGYRRVGQKLGNVVEALLHQNQ